MVGFNHYIHILVRPTQNALIYYSFALCFTAPQDILHFVLYISALSYMVVSQILT